MALRLDGVAELDKGMAAVREQVAECRVGHANRLRLFQPLKVTHNTTLRTFEEWMGSREDPLEAHTLEFKPYYADDGGYLYMYTAIRGTVTMAKLPTPGRTEAAKLITGALRQALVREQLGRLVQPAEQTPARFRLGEGLIRCVACQSDEGSEGGWSRCPDAALLPHGSTRPSLVVEVGMPGEAQHGLHHRCQHWLEDPYAYDDAKLGSGPQRIVVIGLQLVPWRDRCLVTASLLTGAGGVELVEEEIVFVAGEPPEVLTAAGSVAAGAAAVGSAAASAHVWRLPVRYLISAALVEGDRELEEMTVPLDVPAALAPLPALLGRMAAESRV